MKIRNLIFYVLITLLTFSVYLVDGEYSESKVLISNMVIIVLSLLFMVMGDKYNYSLNKMFMLFSFFFFGIAPVLQYKKGITLWRGPSFDSDSYFRMNIIIITILIIYQGMYHIYGSIKSENAVIVKKKGNLILSKKRLLMLSLISTIITLYYNNFNLINLFLRSGADNSDASVNQSIGLIYSYFIRPIPVIALMLFKINKIKDRKFDYIGCNKWETGCYDCPQKKTYPSSIFFDNSKTNYYKKKKLFIGIKNATLITPSNWLAELVKKSFLRVYPLRVINNGIDLSVFRPKESNFRVKYNLQDKFIILGVANIWDERKGFKYFIELSPKLKSDEIIVLVGLTENQKRQLPKNIIGICRTNNVEELAEIYTAADVFVNPTLEDTFPTTNLEALACGTPVITFNTGGSPESVRENCGFIVEKGNIGELVSKINEIKRKGKLDYSGEAIYWVKKLYNKKDKFNEYLEIYEKQLSYYKSL